MGERYRVGERWGGGEVAIEWGRCGGKILALATILDLGLLHSCFHDICLLLCAPLIAKCSVYSYDIFDSVCM